MNYLPMGWENQEFPCDPCKIHSQLIKFATAKTKVRMALVPPPEKPQDTLCQLSQVKAQERGQICQIKNCTQVGCFSQNCKTFSNTLFLFLIFRHIYDEFQYDEEWRMMLPSRTVCYINMTVHTQNCMLT